MISIIKNITITCVFLISSLSYANHLPKQAVFFKSLLKKCNDILFKNSASDTDKNLIQKNIELSSLLKLAKEGKATLPITPKNYEVKLEIFPDTEYSSLISTFTYPGKIVRFRKNKNGQYEINFLIKVDGSYSLKETIPISKIKTISLRKVLTNKQIEETKTKFIEAVSQGLGVHFIIQYPAPRQEEARLLRIKKSKYNTDYFVYQTMDGYEIAEPISSVDPSSIEFIPINNEKTETPPVINNPSISGVIQGIENCSFHISSQLYQELNNFIDPKFVFKNISMPEQILRLAQPGKKIDLHFTEGENTVYLNIVRNENGTWSFSNSWLSGRSKTTEDALLVKQFEGSRAIYEFIQHVMQIHGSLIRSNISESFKSDFKKWSQALPDEMNKYTVLQLFLQDQGKAFYFDRKIVDSVTSLDKNQTKLLAAIHYLLKNDLMFYPPSANTNKFKEGIYPQSGPKSAILPYGRNMVGYDLNSSLFLSMERIGLQYVEGEWVHGI